MFNPVTGKFPNQEGKTGTRCDSCAYDQDCHKDAKDPDIWPYGRGCEEYTTPLAFLASFSVSLIRLNDLEFWHDEEY